MNPILNKAMEKQATINVGTIGHVAHGKSTLVRSISGVHTVRFTSEFVRNITIKLGYANAKIYKCDNTDCPRPDCYKAFRSFAEAAPLCGRPQCGGTLRLIRHVSFVDCPGHDILMATMLNGAAVMDAAMLLVSAQETCPQPQTSEHLAAIEIMRLKHLIVVQNKIDLVKQEDARKNHQQIKTFVQGTKAENSPIIPTSAQLGYNVNYVLEYLAQIPLPGRDIESPARMTIVRSFDINEPGTSFERLRGGVAGGSIVRGILNIGDEIEVRPGIITKDADGTFICKPVFSTVVSLNTEQNDLTFAVPGGLIGVGTLIDPSLTRGDRLVGHVLGKAGTLPPIYRELEINFFLLRRVLGVSANDNPSEKIKKLSKDEILMLNIGSRAIGGRVLKSKGDMAKVLLSLPTCTELGEKIALSRKIQAHWRLIGWAKIKGGVKLFD